MNKFEAKHPRATDGKFTEKLRKESGLKLESDNKCSDLDSLKFCTQSNISNSGNPKPGMGVDELETEPEKPMVTSSERPVLHILWGMIKNLAQSLTFTVFAVMLALALCIGVLFFLVETDSNKNETQMPDGTKTATATIATGPNKTSAPALEQVKPGTAPTETVIYAVFIAGSREPSSYSGGQMAGE